MDEIYRIPQFGARVGRSAHPLRIMNRNGTFPARGTATERRYHTEADALRFPGGGDVAPQGLTAVCCRVSDRGQRDDLKRQVSAMEAYGPGAGVAVDEWLSEVGGGLHCKRKVFLSLRERIEKREIAHLPVAHRDRPTRFGFDGFEHFATQHGCAIAVVNQESLSPQEAMVADPMSILHSRDLNRSKYDRLVEIAALCGRVRGDAWQRCSGWSTAQQSPREIRDDWMAEEYDWHGLPARLGRATLLDALGDIHACREAAKVPVRKAIWHRTEGDEAERHRLYALLKQNRWIEDSFLHRHMRKRWKGGTSRVKNQIVLEPGAYTAKVRHGRAWVHVQGMERGRRIAIPLREKHTPSGQLRILLRDDGQVEIHHAVNEEDACSTQPGGSETVGVDKGYTEAYTDSDGKRHGRGLGGLLAAESDARKVKGQRRNRMRDLEQKHREAGNIKKADNILHNNLGNRKWDRRQQRHQAQVRDFLCQAAHSVVDRAGTIACEDLTASMKSAKVMHRDTQRRLSGWVKGVMADTLTSISRRRGTALVLVNPAYTSQIDSRTGLLQGERRWDRFYGLDGVVLDADTNAARNILARLYDDEITLYTPFREVKRLLRDRSGTTVGTAPPGLESAQTANAA